MFDEWLTPLATIDIYNEIDLIDFTNVCDNNNQDNSCWIDLNNYYASDDSRLEILSLYHLTRLNVSESIAESGVFNTMIHQISLNFVIVTINHQIIMSKQEKHMLDSIENKWTKTLYVVV